MTGIRLETPKSISSWHPLFLTADGELWSQLTQLSVITFSLLAVSVFLRLSETDVCQFAVLSCEKWGGKKV